MKSDYYDPSLRTNKRWKKNYKLQLKGASDALAEMIEAFHTDALGSVDYKTSQKTAAALVADFIRTLCNDMNGTSDGEYADIIFGDYVEPSLKDALRKTTKQRTTYPRLDKIYEGLADTEGKDTLAANLLLDMEKLSNTVAFLREDTKQLSKNYGLMSEGDFTATAIAALSNITSNTLNELPLLTSYRTAMYTVVGMTYCMPVERANVTPPEEIFITPRMAAAGREITDAVLGLNEAFKKNKTYMCGLASTIGAVLGETSLRSKKRRGGMHKNPETAAQIDAFLSNGVRFLEKEERKKTGTMLNLPQYEAFLDAAETKKTPAYPKSLSTRRYAPAEHPQLEAMLLRNSLALIQERYDLRFWELAEAALAASNGIVGIPEKETTRRDLAKIAMTTAAFTAHTVPLQPEAVLPNISEPLYEHMANRQKTARRAIGHPAWTEKYNL